MKSIVAFGLVFYYFLSAAFATAKPLLTAYVEDIPPFVMLENNHISGAAIDILNSALRKDAIEIDYQQINWARALLQSQKQPNIILTGLNRTPSREAHFHWLLKLPSLNSQEIYLWYLANQDISSAKMQLENATVAAMLDDHKVGYYKNYMQQLGYQENIYTVANRTQAIHMLFKDRVEYILGGKLQKPWKVTALGYDVNQIKRGPKLPDNNKGLYIALSKQTDAKLVKQIKQALAKLSDNGQMDKIIDLWMMKHTRTQTP